ncbi:MAG: hypothetical protein F7C07_02670 [Desulfurococcales archaeon]|nr:hypothetical protein [Desulfurococcales archaeon]
MARQKVKARIVSYKRSRVRAGDVKLEALKPARVEELEERGDPREVLMKLVETSTRRGDADFIEVSVEAGDVKEFFGDSPRHAGGRMLYPRPARLLRVGVVRVKRLAEAGSGAVELKEGDVEWHTVRGNIYVYEARIEAPDDVALVIIDTSEGRRVVKIQRSLTRRIFSQTQGRQAGESQSSGSGSGGGSSPS